MGLFPGFESGGINQNCGTYNFVRMTRSMNVILKLNDKYNIRHYLDVSYVKQTY